MESQDQLKEEMRRFAEKVAAFGEAFGVRVESTAWTEPQPPIDCYLVTVATEDAEASAFLSRHWLEGRAGRDARLLLTRIARALGLSLARGSAALGPARALPVGGAVVTSSTSDTPPPQETPCRTS